MRDKAGLEMKTNIIVRPERFLRKLSVSMKSFPEFLEASSMKALLYFHANLAPYPPKPAGSTYRRTMTLWRTITTLQGRAPDALSRVERRAFGEIVAIAGTRLNYAPFVIDEKRQSRAQKSNRWWTLQSEVKRMASGIRDMYRESLNEWIKKNLE